ncbi:peptidylprolyl isomerase [Oharaeibacter diazotrophicus]|uniref:Parvulin-like PPIase n=2 Tax=Oharaeibacter diazotrophicus TaxID=1920512 RepID=A0A4R6R5D8_9HYPH|nr:peptidylprolyl isomerase [Oharaeibacter diazotrophicus]TDP80934.1 peptidyl-prolyl cis-trans isomerase C [Oharaeibacter diazotrophicus]BBE73829.1 putative peptidyl-prolyl cis-trans isomerase Cbf2 precursor [Pleomorphomonas sp. SM30]GLS74687.1 peptidylprolyl isomerase [Oharaeibacter diazotrophicus]
MKSFSRGLIGRRLLTAAAAAAIVVAAHAGVALAADGDVLARVNGKDITKTEVDLAMDIFGEQLQQVPEGARRSMVVDALVDMHVMADAAAAAGLENGQKFKERMSFLTAQALRNSYIEDKIQASVTDADLKARYEKDLANYTPPEEVHARHILVKTEEEANQVIKDIAGGKDFAAVAKEKSEDPGSKENGGDLGFFTKGQMVPDFETAAFGLKPGEMTTKPVKTDFGWHVIKVEERRSQPVPTFEDVKAQVTEVVQREKFQAALTELKAAAKIERLDQPPAAPAAGDAPAAAETPAPAPAQ